jgi:MoaA/NifB/PqqE/SkfB family radical SAM enzyme
MRKRLPNCTIGFVYNEPCPLECDFCCHTKANVGPGMLKPDNVLPMIERYAVHPDVTRFAFTGGAPFVYYNQICEIFTSARSSGIKQPFHIVTSGYWAKSD